MNLEIPNNLIHAAFFFVDIVGLSDPVMSTNTQTIKIKILNESIGDCNTFKSTPKNEKLVLPTGDGMAIGFLNGLEKPLLLAKELHKKLREYNENQVQMDKISTRIGCHSGNIFVVNDVYGNKNFWGPGLILARRVMDLGDTDHILMTSSMAESLIELSDNYKKIIHPIYDYQIKHKEVILLYSLYGDSFGNSNKPTKGLKEKPKLFDNTYDIRKTILYNHVEFNLGLKNVKTNLLQTKRIYHFMNNSNEPIYEVVNGITTNVEKTFYELHVMVTDEINQELKIRKINVDSPLRKEFTIKLNEPVFPGDKNKQYSVTYEVKEPNQFYEHMFLINAQSLTLSFNFPTNEGISLPKLYFINNKDREKRLIDMKPEIRKGVHTQVQWEIENDISEKDIIRLEW